MGPLRTMRAPIATNSAIDPNRLPLVTLAEWITAAMAPAAASTMAATSMLRQGGRRQRFQASVQAATAGLVTAGHGGDQMLLGETAPIGRTTGPLAKRSMPAVDFWRELMCLDSKGRRLTGSNASVRDCRSPGRMAVTGIAHHPYTKGAGKSPTDKGGSRDITLASIGRLYLWVDHPDLEREVAILRRRLPGIDETLARQVTRAVHVLREMELLKPPGVAETLDWARALLELDRTVLDAATASATLGAVLKYREDLARVARAGLDRLVAG